MEDPRRGDHFPTKLAQGKPYAATVGTLLYWGTFGSASTVGAGATASFAIGALKVTEA